MGERVMTAIAGSDLGAKAAARRVMILPQTSGPETLLRPALRVCVGAGGGAVVTYRAARLPEVAPSEIICSIGASNRFVRDQGAERCAAYHLPSRFVEQVWGPRWAARFESSSSTELKLGRQECADLLGEPLAGHAYRAIASDPSRKLLNALVRLLKGPLASFGRQGSSGPVEATDPRIDRALRLIHQSFTQPLRIQALAKTVGMSESHFAHTFTALIGTSPYAYLTHLRVEVARSLVARGDSLADVALSVGLSDQSHLCRHFRKILGVSPGRYRRAVQSVNSSGDSCAGHRA